MSYADSCTEASKYVVLTPHKARLSHTYVPPDRYDVKWRCRITLLVTALKQDWKEPED